jgi:hypothetical protein
MNIKEVINVLNSNKVDGFQLSKRNGIISSTWLLYKKLNFFYYFDINLNIKYIDSYKYSEEELINELQYSIYEIDLVIN